ncbi:MAG: hypothetical protein QOE97_146 [Pseudonocardiales bacterium]|jgi:hypothetical protein|nr:hypothetical protein [Pseudonocardiales bacterium]
MRVDEYVEQVRRQLAAAAALGDEEVQRVAVALAESAVPAVRLALMAALAEAADEITDLLVDYPLSPAVSVRLDGDFIRTEVQGRAAEAEPAAADDGEASARISLRLTDALKAQIDAAAARDGVSVNTWLMRAATAAVAGPRPTWTAGGTATHRISGYING